MNGDPGRDLDRAMRADRARIDAAENLRDGLGGQAQLEADRDAGDRYERDHWARSA